jgi:hypothetical protein
MVAEWKIKMFPEIVPPPVAEPPTEVKPPKVVPGIPSK